MTRTRLCRDDTPQVLLVRASGPAPEALMKKNWKCTIEEVRRSAGRGNNFTTARQAYALVSLRLRETCDASKTHNETPGCKLLCGAYLCACVCVAATAPMPSRRQKAELEKTAAASRVSPLLRLHRARQAFCVASLAATFGGLLSAPNLLVSRRVDGGVGDTTVRGRETRGGGCLGNAGRL